jgi:glycosyltransferase involved in cell wall biosynthesis
LAVFQPSFAAVGGAELLAAMQAAYFQAQGIDVKVVTFGVDAARWRERLAGLPVVSVAKRHWSDPFVAWTRLAKLKRRAQRAAQVLQKCDVVLAYNYPCSTMLAVAEIGARKVWQCNEPPKNLHMREANPVLAARVHATAGGGPEDVCAAFAQRLVEYDRSVARKAFLHALRAFDIDRVSRLDEIYAISAFSRDNARRIYGRCREEVIPPMVRFPAAVAPRHGLDRSGLKVLVHSRLEQPKNIDTVLRGFARFRGATCPQAQLHVVGGGGYRPRLESLARELCPADAVHFHGFLTDADARRVYAVCDVMALLPVDEPFGMVFPEAAAHGLLLVGPDHGGPLEILDGGRLGWVCDAFSPDALAGAFANIWALDDATIDRRRDEADRACRARYMPDIVGRQLLRVLK